MPGGGKNTGYVCSNALATQTSAIVAGCRPEINQAPAKPSAGCGDYLIDLSTKSAFDTRLIKTLPVGTSCTYRVYSTCGYPNAAVKILNPTIAQDFDIHYAAQTGIKLGEDLASEWQLDQTVDWEGAYGSGADGALDFISEGYTSTKVSQDEFEKCKGPNRNLWVTVTRVKETKPAAQAFLEMTPRQLQTLYNDIEFGFASIQGNAQLLSVLSFAMVALLSVFAF